MSQEQYADFKADRADALLDLASATEADDTTAILAGHRIRLWKGGPAISVRAATTAALRDATKDVRAHAAATSTKPHRGRSATPDERSAARSATERLRGKGSSARVAVRATQPGKPSVFDIIGLSAAELDRSLAAIARGKSRG